MVRHHSSPSSPFIPSFQLRILAPSSCTSPRSHPRAAFGFSRRQLLGGEQPPLQVVGHELVQPSPASLAYRIHRPSLATAGASLGSAGAARRGFPLLRTLIRSAPSPPRSPSFQSTTLFFPFQSTTLLRRRRSCSPSSYQFMLFLLLAWARMMVSSSSG